MKILWNSVAPWVPTGYGQQTSLFAPRIRDLGHDVAISANFGMQGGISHWNGFKVYPADTTHFNKRLLKSYVNKEGGRDNVQVITLQDLWTLVDPKFGGMIADWRGLNIASWVPIDCDPVSPATVAAIQQYDIRPIAMSRFGERTLREVGFDPMYVPHGIDTNVFKPQPAENRKAAREAMGIPTDAFVVGMVANNQGVTPPRKAFPQVFEAFAVLLREKPDAYLYLHTEKHGTLDGLNLAALADVYGIPDANIGWVGQDAYLCGEISPPAMSLIYGAMDVLANPSYGEGFGIPIIEAQACGVPVIVTNWTSMPELVGAGWTVEGDPWYNPGHGSRWKCPNLSELLDALRAAYDTRDDQGLRDKARAFALAYDADTVTDTYWKPVLAALERPREVGALPNRAARRAKRKVAA